MLRLIDSTVERGKEPRQPRRDIEGAFLGPLKDVVIRLAVTLDLRRQAVEPLRVAIGTCEQQVAIYPTSSRIKSPARQASAVTGPFVFPDGIVGITEQSATRSPSTPRTRKRSSVTPSGLLSIAQVPTAW